MDPAGQLSKSAKPLTVDSKADLHDIIRYGDISQLKEALEEKKYNPLDKDVNGYTALHIAALYGRVELMRYLIEEEQLYPTISGPKKATPLIIAAECGNLSVVKYLIEEQRIDPSADRDEDGYLAIHRACLESKLNIVKYLLLTMEEVCFMESSNIFREFTRDATALIHIAALSGNIDTVKYFVEECKCDPNLLNAAGQTALYYACKNGSLEVVQYLVEVGHCQPSITDSSLNTPLHLAAQHGNLLIVQYLVDKQKCDANTKNNNRNTPLHEASYAGQWNVVKFLLDKHCDPHQHGGSGYNCLHAAVSNGHMDVIQYLIEEQHMDPSAHTNNKGSKTNSLHIAAQHGQPLVIEYLTDRAKLDLNSPDENGNSSLLLAILNDKFEVVKNLIDFKKCALSSIPKSFEVKSTRIRQFLNEYRQMTGNTITDAILASQTELGDLEFLKQQPKSVLQRYIDREFQRPLIFTAVELGQLNIVQYFIEEKIFKSDLKDKHDFTLLHTAAAKGHVEVFRYLAKECSCDPKCRSKSIFPESMSDVLAGTLPLHLAAYCGHLSMVKHILESAYGIDPEVSNLIGTTPLQFAAMEGHLHIIKYLIKKHKCNPAHKDNKNTTAIYFAADDGRFHVIRYLVEEMKCDPGVCTLGPFTLLLLVGILI